MRGVQDNRTGVRTTSSRPHPLRLREENVEGSPLGMETQYSSSLYAEVVGVKAEMVEVQV